MSFTVCSFVVKGATNVNKNFAILYVAEPICEIIGLYLGRPATKGLCIFGKPYSHAGFGPSGVSSCFCFSSMEFFSRSIVRKASTFDFSLTMKL